MKASDSTADEFDRLAKTISRDQRVDPPEVAKANRFGSKGLKVQRKLFAFRSSKGTLVVKLPKDRVDELVKEGIGERYDPGHGRLMKEWLAVGLRAKKRWMGLAKEALEFASRNSA